MSDRPTEADVMAAVERDDYQWLVTHVLIPALLQIMREDHTNALINNPRPRARRAAGTRRPRTRRSHEFRP
jgi:hypothetical protein